MDAHKLKIVSAEKENVQADSSEQLAVCVQITRGEEVVGVRRFGFPLDATKEEIEADLERVRLNLDRDAELAEVNKAHEERQAKADATIAGLMEGKEEAK